MTQPDLSPPPPTTQLVLVTGPSGAGRSTAIRVLEDNGFETIDNLPLGLVPRLLDGPAHDRPLGLVVDARNRDFTTTSLLATISLLQARRDLQLTVLYLDCRPEVLLRRYSETRRRHPLAPAEGPETGIARELDLLEQVRDRADLVIDTSEINVHQLRAEVEKALAPGGSRNLAVTVHSFSYKRGLPMGIDMAFDCRFLRNPYWQPALRPHDGRDADVATHVAGDPRYPEFRTKVLDLTRFLLPAYVDEGKSHFSVAFGCTGGQHRSVMLAESVGATLAEEGWQVSIRHRELERQR
ncbi:RNase adapter RapZ [Marinibacterium profundimaris]|uniref:GlmZ(SRNA)-inactivating NTPase n=1 Tax=Marinibacterium profundimaris TaxID=1679460 RepID=A0A225NH22_9RHOB|nr:RNase adapter RapZ [Marinibacterium profundimaris]OWU71732.1 glmZ(sRNA)-inactivating NTPase [Marinibacterium profundimaris]